jgi:hypothetical protein
MTTRDRTCHWCKASNNNPRCLHTCYPRSCNWYSAPCTCLKHRSDHSIRHRPRRPAHPIRMRWCRTCHRHRSSSCNNRSQRSMRHPLPHTGRCSKCTCCSSDRTVQNSTRQKRCTDHRSGCNSPRAATKSRRPLLHRHPVSIRCLRCLPHRHDSIERPKSQRRP